MILWAAAALALTGLGAWWALSLRDPIALEGFTARVSSLGLGGWFVMLGIQYLQIVLSFIPGGPIQVSAGALFGPFGGLLVIVVGILLANTTIFALVRRFGRRVLRYFVTDDYILKYKFLSDSKKLHTLVLILFFIPGTPKDALTYLFALTPISFRRFIILSLPARLPMILLSVFAGESILEGRFFRAGIILMVFALMAAFGALIKRRLFK